MLEDLYNISSWESQHLKIILMNHMYIGKMIKMIHFELSQGRGLNPEGASGYLDGFVVPLNLSLGGGFKHFYF